jgi:microcin C transport system substrate-binding protein
MKHRPESTDTPSHRRTTVRCWLAVIASLGLGACSEGVDERFPPYDNTEEVKAFWESKPDFFQWKTAADLPPDLEWKSGEAVPELGDPRATKGGTFTYYHPTFPPTFRHVGPDGNNTFRGEHWDNVTISLVERNLDEDAWIPGTAEAWAVTADRRTVFFRLDPTATFSDGVPLAVEDYFMTFFVMLSPHLKDPWYNDWYAKEYEAITKYTEQIFSVTIPNPKPDPIWYAMLPPSPRHFYREFGPDYPARYQWRIQPTIGAYEIRADLLKRGRRITLGRVKNWWARDKKHFRYRFNADFIDYPIIASMDKAFEMLRQGKLDYFLGGLPVYWYDKSEIPEVHRGYIERHSFYNEFPQVTWGVYLNESQLPLDNQAVRTGINYAMDFKKVVEVDFRGDKARMNSIFSGFGKFTNPKLRAKPFDPQKARELFAKAGYRKPGPDGILVNGQGKRLSLKLSTFNSGPIVPIMLRLKEGAKKAGLEIVVEKLDGTQLYKKLDQKNHELAFAGFGARPPYPKIWDFFHSDNAWKTGEDGKREVVTDTNNITMTADPKLDVLIDEYRDSKTEDELQERAWVLQKMIEDRGCTIPAWESPFYRWLSWRWVRWPENGNAKVSREPTDAFMFWIDEEVRAETLEARDKGESFGEATLVHDHFKRQ